MCSSDLSHHERQACKLMVGLLDLAARGACNMDRSEEWVKSGVDRDSLRSQARLVHRRALVTAGLLTAVALLWP